MFQLPKIGLTHKHLLERFSPDCIQRCWSPGSQRLRLLNDPLRSQQSSGAANRRHSLFNVDVQLFKRSIDPSLKLNAFEISL
jgi:hypothetical protein